MILQNWKEVSSVWQFNFWLKVDFWAIRCTMKAVHQIENDVKYITKCLYLAISHQLFAAKLQLLNISYSIYRESLIITIANLMATTGLSVIFVILEP